MIKVGRYRENHLKNGGDRTKIILNGIIAKMIKYIQNNNGKGLDRQVLAGNRKERCNNRSGRKTPILLIHHNN